MSNSVLVDGKCESMIGHKGKRICVSIPKMMFNYFVINSGGRETALYLIREEIKAGLVSSSIDAQEFVLNEIVKPSLYRKMQSSSAEVQYDLEDY